MSASRTDCPRCMQARRLASFCFAGFAVALVLSATDSALDPMRQAALLACGVATALAVIRHPLARLLHRTGQNGGTDRVQS